MRKHSSSNLNASLATKVFRRGPVTITHWQNKVRVSRRDIRIWNQLGNNTHSTATELDQGSLASVETAADIAVSGGSAHVQLLYMVFYIRVIWQRLLLTASFKEFINCRDIAYFHYVLLEMREGRQNIKMFFPSRARMIWSRIMSARLSWLPTKTFVHESVCLFKPRKVSKYSLGYVNHFLLLIIWFEVRIHLICSSEIQRPSTCMSTRFSPWDSTKRRCFVHLQWRMLRVCTSFHQFQPLVLARTADGYHLATSATVVLFLKIRHQTWLHQQFKPNSIWPWPFG